MVIFDLHVFIAGSRMFDDVHTCSSVDKRVEVEEIIVGGVARPKPSVQGVGSGPVNGFQVHAQLALL